MKRLILYTLLFMTIAFALAMAYLKKTQTTNQTTTMNKLDKIETKIVPEHIDTAILAAGCFWCVEVALEQLPGVLNVVSGYIGGYVCQALMTHYPKHKLFTKEVKVKPIINC